MSQPLSDKQKAMRAKWFKRRRDNGYCWTCSNRKAGGKGGTPKTCSSCAAKNRIRAQAYWAKKNGSTDRAWEPPERVRMLIRLARLAVPPVRLTEEQINQRVYPTIEA